VLRRITVLAEKLIDEKNDRRSQHWTHKLKDESYEWRKRIATVQRVILDQRVYLAGPKFQGPCENYISTHEVWAMLDRINANLNGDPNDEYGDRTDNEEYIEAVK
jgi:hypothetical protein